MDTPNSELQAMLRETLARFLSEHAGFERHRSLHADDATWSPDTWRALAEDIGLLGAAFPESIGGFGGGAVENMIVMEEMGRALALEPYLSTAIMAGEALKRADRDTLELQRELVAGRLICAVASDPTDLQQPSLRILRGSEGLRIEGEAGQMRDAPFATHILSTAADPEGGSGCVLVLLPIRRHGIEQRPLRTIDAGWASDVTFHQVDLREEDILASDAAMLCVRIGDAGRAAICAESVGIMEALFASTRDYLQQREQFGKPLSSFQVLRHRIAEMHVAIDGARAMTMMAALAMDEKDGDGREQRIAAACAHVSVALRKVGQGAIQLHGGIGTTDELPVAHYFRRISATEALYGSPDDCLADYVRHRDGRAAVELAF
tara:strand:+ start:5242 stop:6375 length:1134 start_codon:yes stop_codon:yes gene_type:complete